MWEPSGRQRVPGGVYTRVQAPPALSTRKQPQLLGKRAGEAGGPWGHWSCQDSEQVCTPRLRSWRELPSTGGMNTGDLSRGWDQHGRGERSVGPPRASGGQQPGDCWLWKELVRGQCRNPHILQTPHLSDLEPMLWFETMESRQGPLPCRVVWSRRWAFPEMQAAVSWERQRCAERGLLLSY